MNTLDKYELELLSKHHTEMADHFLRCKKIYVDMVNCPAYDKDKETWQRMADEREVGRKHHRTKARVYMYTLTL